MMLLNYKRYCFLNVRRNTSTRLRLRGAIGDAEAVGLSNGTVK
jgi:hypothetical protein